jgi:hypothetical protein
MDARPAAPDQSIELQPTWFQKNKIHPHHASGLRGRVVRREEGGSYAVRVPGTRRDVRAERADFTLVGLGR